MLLFFLPSTLASHSDVPIPLAGYTAEYTWHATRGRTLPTLDIAYSSAITFGTISVQLKKNGVDLGDPAVLSIAQHLATVTLDDSMAPGDRLTCHITSSADLAPVEQTLVALIP